MRGICNSRGIAPKLIRLDCKQTKEYNYYCNFSYQFNHLSFEVINSTKEAVSLLSSNLKQYSTKILLIVPLMLLFTACSQPIYKVEVQEVLVPIKCNLSLPKKPKDNGSFKSHKDLAKYYLEVEQIAKECTNGESK